MNRLPKLLALALPACLAASGCTGTILREGAGVALGAKGIVAPIQPLAASKSDRPLGDYTRFELGAMEDDTGGKVPADFYAALPREFQEELARKKLPDEAGGKTAVLRGRIIHYEDASTLLSVLGPMEEVICRTELVDKDSGKVLGVANCVGRTTENVNRGARKKADGLAKAFAAWIESAYPRR